MASHTPHPSPPSTSTTFANGPISSLSYTNHFTDLAVICDNHSTIQFTSIPTVQQLHTINPTPLLTSSTKYNSIKTTASFTSISYPDQTCLYTTDNKGTLSRYNPTVENEKNRLVSQIPAAHSGNSLTAVTSLSPSSIIVTAGKDGIIRAWDSQTNQSILKLVGHRYDIRSLALATSDLNQHESISFVVSGGRDRTVKLWDIKQKSKSGSLIHSFEGHTGWVHDVAIKDGQYIVSCSGDKSVRVWDLRMMNQKYLFKGHQYRTWGVDVSQSTDSDHDFVVSGSTDTTVRLWNLNENYNDTNDKNIDNMIVMDGHRDSVLSVGCNRDGSIILSACEDGSLFAWSGNGRFGKQNSNSDNTIINTEMNQSTKNSNEEPQEQPLLIDLDNNQNAIPNKKSSDIIPKQVDMTRLPINNNSNSTTPTSETTKRPHQDPTYDKSAAELVVALRRIQELETLLKDSQRRSTESSRTIDMLRNDLTKKDDSIKRLEKEVSVLKKMENAVKVNELLNQKERNFENFIGTNEQEAYKEPVNRIGAVSDQLTKLAARLDAMIATS